MSGGGGILAFVLLGLGACGSERDPLPALQAGASGSAQRGQVADLLRAEDCFTRGMMREAEGDWGAAEDAFGDCLQADPRHPLASGHRGYCRYQAGNIRGAIEDLRAAIGLTADRVEFGRWLCLAEYEVGDLDAAGAVLAQVVERDPTEASRLLWRGRTTDAADHDAAEARYSKRLAAEPADHLARFLRANARFAAGRKPQALADYRAIVAAKPDFGPAHWNIAEMHRAAGAHAPARAAYERAALAMPRCARLHVILGAVLDRMGEPERARESCARAIEIAPPSGWALAVWAFAQARQGDSAAAIAAITTAVRIDPSLREVATPVPLEPAETTRTIVGAWAQADPRNAAAWFFLGNLFRREKDLGRAIEHFQRAIAVGPGFGLARIRLAEALREQGNHDAALTELRAAAQVDDPLPLAHLELGRTLHAKGAHPDAVAEFQRAVDADPRTWLFHAWLGCARDDTGNPDGAVAALTSAIRLDAVDAYSYFRRGRTRARMQDLDGAILDLSRSLQIDGRQAEAYLERGLAWQSKGSRREAIADLARIVHQRTSAADRAYHALDQLGAIASCPACGGAGLVTCQGCSGSGRRADGGMCLGCVAGSGRRPCFTCDGHGWTVSDK